MTVILPPGRRSGGRHLNEIQYSREAFWLASAKDTAGQGWRGRKDTGNRGNRGERWRGIEKTEKEDMEVDKE